MQDLRRSRVVYDTPILGSGVLGHVYTEDGPHTPVLGMQVGEFREGEGRTDVGVDHVEFFEVGEDCVPDCIVGGGNETEGFLLARLLEDAEYDHCLCPCLCFDRRYKTQKQREAEQSIEPGNLQWYNPPAVPRALYSLRYLVETV